MQRKTLALFARQKPALLDRRCRKPFKLLSALLFNRRLNALWQSLYESAPSYCFVRVMPFYSFVRMSPSYSLVKVALS